MKFDLSLELLALVFGLLILGLGTALVVFVTKRVTKSLDKFSTAIDNNALATASVGKAVMSAGCDARYAGEKINTTLDLGVKGLCSVASRTADSAVSATNLMNIASANITTSIKTIADSSAKAATRFDVTCTDLFKEKSNEISNLCGTLTNLSGVAIAAMEEFSSDRKNRDEETADTAAVKRLTDIMELLRTIAGPLLDLAFEDTYSDAQKAEIKKEYTQLRQDRNKVIQKLLTSKGLVENLAALVPQQFQEPVLTVKEKPKPEEPKDKKDTDSAVAALTHDPAACKCYSCAVNRNEDAHRLPNARNGHIYKCICLDCVQIRIASRPVKTAAEAVATAIPNPNGHIHNKAATCLCANCAASRLDDMKRQPVGLAGHSANCACIPCKKRRIVSRPIHIFLSPHNTAAQHSCPCNMCCSWRKHDIVRYTDANEMSATDGHKHTCACVDCALQRIATRHLAGDNPS